MVHVDAVGHRGGEVGQVHGEGGGCTGRRAREGRKGRRGRMVSCARLHMHAHDVGGRRARGRWVCARGGGGCGL